MNRSSFILAILALTIVASRSQPIRLRLPHRNFRYYEPRMRDSESEESVESASEESEEAYADLEDDDDDTPSFSKLFPGPHNNNRFHPAFYRMRHEIEVNGWKRPRRKPTREEPMKARIYVGPMYGTRMGNRYRSENDFSGSESEESPYEDFWAPPMNKMFPNPHNRPVGAAAHPSYAMYKPHAAQLGGPAAIGYAGPLARRDNYNRFQSGPWYSDTRGPPPFRRYRSEIPAYVIDEPSYEEPRSYWRPAPWDRFWGN